MKILYRESAPMKKDFYEKGMRMDFFSNVSSKTHVRRIPAAVALAFLVLFGGGCRTLEKMAVRSTHSLLDSQYRAFLREEDPVLAREAAAGNIKLIDGMLLEDPGNPELLLLSAKALFSYAFGFAEDQSPQRASRLYMRGFRSAAEIVGGADLFFDMPPEAFRRRLEKKLADSLPAYFWATLNFASWVRRNKSDLRALRNRAKVEAVGRAVVDVDENYYFGGGHLLLGLYYASEPEPLGGEPERARRHFEKCLEIAQRRFLPAQYFFARWYAVHTQNRALFDRLLSEIEAFDLDRLPAQRLTNTIIKEKAAALRKRADDFFIE
jgi:hypothetical protein